MSAVPFRVGEAPVRPVNVYLEAVLDRLDRAVLVVDGDLKVQFANASARRIVNRADAIALDERRLKFLAPLVHRRVTNFLAGVSKESATKSGAASFWSSLPRSSGASDYRLAVHLLPNDSGAGLPPFFAVEIYEPLIALAVQPQVLRDLFGLTPTEATVVAGLFAGTDVNALSAQMAISRNTVRTHIRAAYVKCEVHSLPQLLQLLALSPR